MTTRKLKRRLQDAYGKAPNPFYFDGDMDYIRAYYNFRRINVLDSYLIDDTTWNDLDMDRVFKRINPKRCTSGEQYLYYMLRSPCVDEKRFLRRKAMIDYAQSNSQRRLRVEVILARLGCTRRADLCRAFYPTQHGHGRLLVYLLLLVALILSVLSLSINVGVGVRATIICLTLNSLVHEFGRRQSQTDYDTVNYIVSMIFAVRKIRKLHDAVLDEQMQEAYACLDRLQAVIHTGGISTEMDTGGMVDAFLTVTLLDLILYEFLKNKFGRCQRDVFTIHEYLGRLDAAISIASYRESVENYSEPELQFTQSPTGRIHAEGLRHPLLQNAVPNDLITEHPILITGSNASGKSTYLKTAALAAIMAQSICTVLATSYKANAFRILSSIALRDDLLGGESYYIVETRSLKRILDAAEEHHPIFCVVDEVLRGTNTVERIAASSEVLKTMAEKGILCLAATHDVELCDLLEESYTLFHFEERISEDTILFDYILRKGRASSQNAIALLKLIGFDAKIVERARERANMYIATKSWQR